MTNTHSYTHTNRYTSNKPKYKHNDLQSYMQTTIHTYAHSANGITHNQKTNLQAYTHTDTRAYTHTDIQTYEHTDIQLDEHTNTMTYRLRDGQKDNQTHTRIQTYRQTNRQTLSHTHIQTHEHTYIQRSSRMNMQ